MFDIWFKDFSHNSHVAGLVAEATRIKNESIIMATHTDFRRITHIYTYR